jgi:hypothetical protein
MKWGEARRVAANGEQDATVKNPRGSASASQFSSPLVRNLYDQKIGLETEST